MPVDLVWGDADALFPPAYAERLAAGLPAAQEPRPLMARTPSR